MKIKRILSQHRRDFNAIFICELCGHEKEGSGYDDTYFHNEVVPRMKCTNCGKIASTSEPMKPKYPDGYQV